MYGCRLGLGLNRSFRLSYEEQIRVFRRIGFEAFFSDWDNDTDLARLRGVADDTGMIFQSVHAPFVRIDRMWEPTEETPSVIAEQLSCLRDCADNGIPIMVCHAYIGFEKHTPTAEGLDNFAILVREAEKLGVKIAFENTEGEEYLAALMRHFQNSSAVGFCWDTGHEMCYNHSKDMTAFYGSRLIATHLNDNLGIKDFDGNITFHDDLHLLPFDGIADWNDIARRLNLHHYDGILTFELKNVGEPDRREHDVYSRMEPEEYLTLAYMRACRVAALKQRTAL